MRTQLIGKFALTFVLAVLANVGLLQAQYWNTAAGTPNSSPYAMMPAGGFGGGSPMMYPAGPVAYAPEMNASQMAMMGGYPGMAMMPPGMAPYGVQPAAMQEPIMADGRYPDGGYVQDGMEGGYADDGYYEGDEGYGGRRRGLRRGRNLLDLILPYGEGGLAAPRWFDFYVDGVWLKRDKISRDQSFSSSGINGPRVLGTTNLDFDQELGFRAGAAIQISPGGSVEFGYLGTHFFSSAASVNDPTNQLYSVLGNFGLNFSFDDTDRAFLHRIEYTSRFNSYDLNYRRRWTGQDDRLQGSWLAGVRYFQLNEQFKFQTRTNLGPPFVAGSMDYVAATTNSMIGFQVGGDSWLTLIPGFRIGVEAKAGIYGNDAYQTTTITAHSLAQPLNERARRTAPAFLGELNAMAIYRFNDHWTLRGGYQFLFVEHVALATENFNAEPPQVFLPAGFVSNRVVGINDTANVFLHGLTLGAEYMW